MTHRKSLQTQILICGLGGQGVLFLTRLINEAAVLMGENVISSETHGMAMRGGSVVSYVRIGDYKAPLIRAGQADVILSLADQELALHAHLLKDNCQIYVNLQRGKKNGAINASRIAEGLGAPVITNLVLLGFAAAHKEFPVDYALIKKVLKNISPPRVLELNTRALEEGFKAAQNNPGAAASAHDA
jgi:indolepyruvate ferredoxin oxidoreductase, beta subunit